jgi:heme oxygenase
MALPRRDIPRSSDGDRWPPLLLALRRAARPDRARVAAYVSLTRRPAGRAAYTEFLALHRAWIASLDRVLAEAGAAPAGPLPDAPDEAEERGAPIPRAPAEASPAGLPVPRTWAQALGYRYVLEAFRLGCSVLARRIGGRARSEGPADAVEAHRSWEDLVRALGRVPPEDHPAVIQSAREAFSGWEQRLAGSLAQLGVGPRSADAHAA